MNNTEFNQEPENSNNWKDEELDRSNQQNPSQKSDDLHTIQGSQSVGGEREIFVDSVNFVRGDFVGRDIAVYHGSAYTEGNTYFNETHYSTQNSENFHLLPTKRTIEQIQRLRGRVTRLIPTHKSLSKLDKLRRPSTTFQHRETTISLSYLSLLKIHTVFISPQQKKHPENLLEKLEEKYLTVLYDIESKISEEMDTQEKSDSLRCLNSITDEINVQISNLNSLFNSFVYSASSAQESIGNMTTKIGHKELREEAQMNLNIVTQLASKLDTEELTNANFDVLSNEAQVALGYISVWELIYNWEKHRLAN
ncbi:MAG: hypothetical protein J7647_21395 [Cyanobacteria bacterium SBLK]|nr:hypothetical protein [Cyanobacteria bacterium SBLK]